MIPRFLFCSCVHVSHKRTASQLHPSSSLRSSSNRQASCVFLHNVRGCPRIISLFSLCFLLLLGLLLSVSWLWWESSMRRVLLVRLCKMLMGTSLCAFENAPRPPPCLQCASFAKMLIGSSPSAIVKIPRHPPDVSPV